MLTRGRGSAITGTLRTSFAYFNIDIRVFAAIFASRPPFQLFNAAIQARTMMRLAGIHSGASTHTHGQVIRSASRNPMKSRARHSKKFGLWIVTLLSFMLTSY